MYFCSHIYEYSTLMVVVTKSTIVAALPMPTMSVTGSMMTEKSATTDNSTVHFIALPITAAVAIIVIALITLSSTE